VKTSVIFLLTFTLLLAGCVQPMEATTAAPATASPFPNTPIPPTATPSQTPTATSTSAPTNVPPTATATPIILDGASLLAYGLMENGTFLVTVKVPGGVVGEFSARIGEDEFTCQMLHGFDDRLYCSGPRQPAGDKVTFEIFPVGGDQAAFTGQFTVPWYAAAAPTSADEGNPPPSKKKASG
jgi:hypothetical protein